MGQFYRVMSREGWGKAERNTEVEEECHQHWFSESRAFSVDAESIHILKNAGAAFW